MVRIVFSSVLLILFMGSCNLIKKSSGEASKYSPYHEDLSSSRITFPDLSEASRNNELTGGSSKDISSIDYELDQALQKFAKDNKSEQYYSGFTVLVYSGVDRDQAFKTRNDLYTKFPDIKSDMQYQQPRYLVKVGKFINRIEAQSHYHKLKEVFPMARIIQDRFQREGFVNTDEKINNDQGQN
ncbi:hypothetical protein ACFOUP_13720 [Belliella kenyensis]|uniref:SPOR domain-containing protein n=1 Tax=Belliella kenyensis TaxID=1472724 RepID=A0ABV8EQK1_9BACT|nr:hypothetical protein [Belliella kenyensis]MCH7401500.1 hypothetical protein [Belliella kenyensis]MDN3603219.1 hypothetical protein [Belliella kenyensis]